MSQKTGNGMHGLGDVNEITALMGNQVSTAELMTNNASTLHMQGESASNRN